MAAFMPLPPLPRTAAATVLPPAPHRTGRRASTTSTSTSSLAAAQVPDLHRCPPGFVGLRLLLVDTGRLEAVVMLLAVVLQAATAADLPAMTAGTAMVAAVS